MSDSRDRSPGNERFDSNFSHRSRISGCAHHAPSTRGRSIPGFAGAAYQEQATLAREAPDLLQDGPAVRRSMFEEGAAFYADLRLPTAIITSGTAWPWTSRANR